MKTPLHLQFRGMEPTDSLQQLASDHVNRLESLAGDVMACRVSIEQLQKHQHQGRPYGVMIDLTLPGRELTVNRVQHEDVYVAMRDAFDAMRRQLEAVVQRRRGEVKQQKA
ncbi:MAG: ribosome-associated translation inhibitor RaiA [Burkholderiaceae bacterium]|nr:ribosome-associated translation inhibitor RaiA [Burkholderiaceae bacterium]